MAHELRDWEPDIARYLRTVRGDGEGYRVYAPRSDIGGIFSGRALPASYVQSVELEGESDEARSEVDEANACGDVFPRVVRDARAFRGDAEADDPALIPRVIRYVKQLDGMDIVLAGSVMAFLLPFLGNFTGAALWIAAATVSAAVAKAYAGS